MVEGEEAMNKPIPRFTLVGILVLAGFIGGGGLFASFGYSENPFSKTEAFTGGSYRYDPYPLESWIYLPVGSKRDPKSRSDILANDDT